MASPRLPKHKEKRKADRLPGREVAQLYIGILTAPIKQLRGFERTDVLQVGESMEVEFALQRRVLSVWNVEAQGWGLQRGNFGIWIGASSRDVRLSGELVV